MSFGKTVNLGNSIIGVSILAMPYCFVQSGVILSILLIILSGFLTRLSCHLLLKSAFISKRRSFELMVHDVLGSTGRLLVELGLIGFLLGTCVAYFIMIGDLAPKILIELLELKYNKHLRLFTVLFLSIFVALPLSLLKSVDSLTSFSLLSMILYSCLILKLMFETTDKLSLVDKLEPGGGDHINDATLQTNDINNDQDSVGGDVYKLNVDNFSYWNMSGLLRTFPIFSMAMSCQTSLFEIFDNSVIVSDLEAIKRDNCIIKKAIYMCSFVYITVGLFGYMAFHEQNLYGNILLAFPPSLTTTLTKIGFIITLLMSFPLCLFPCRTSVHSLTLGKIKKSAQFQPIPTSTSAATLVGMVGLESDYSGSNIKDIDRDNNNDNNYNNGNKSLPAHQIVANNNYTMSISGTATNRIATNHHYIKTNSASINSNSYTSLLDDNDGVLVDQMTSATSFNHNDVGNLSTATDGHHNHTNLPSRLYISDFHFRLLTVILIAITVTLSLMFPHIEFILGIIGSTAGTTVCFILPAYTFIRIGEHTRTELILAKLLLLIGLAMLIFCSYSTIHNASLETPS